MNGDMMNFVKSTFFCFLSGISNKKERTRFLFNFEVTFVKKRRIFNLDF